MFIKIKRALMGSKNFFKENEIDYIFKRNENQIIFDIGSHSGFEIHDMLSLNPVIEIFAFECDCNAIQIFKKKWKKKIRNGQIKLIDKALSDQSGTIDFFPSINKTVDINKNTKINWSLSGSLKKPKNHLKEYNVEFGKPVKVNTISLDEFYNKNFDKQIISLCYADVNGGEKELINGGINTLNRRVKYFYTEYCDNELYTDQPSLEWIKNKLENFEMIKIIKNNVLFKNLNI